MVIAILQACSARAPTFLKPISISPNHWLEIFSSETTSSSNTLMLSKPILAKHITTCDPIAPAPMTAIIFSVLDGGKMSYCLTNCSGFMLNILFRSRLLYRNHQALVVCKNLYLLNRRSHPQDHHQGKDSPLLIAKHVEFL